MNRQYQTVLVALSGGIDSAYAALSLKEAGRRVHGLHLMLPATPSIADARRKSVQKIGDHLQIPIEVSDYKTQFTQKVIEPFINAYLTGLTPNPCVICNEAIKFEALLQTADRLQLDTIATGHYARLEKGDDRATHCLKRGKDIRKDQSYFLHRLGLSHLSRAEFPLGEMTKNEVKARALEMGLPAPSIPESQEICFIPENEYRSFIREHKGPAIDVSGEIVNDRGEVLGTHTGTYRYTVGQRHGLGIASSRPYYVKEIQVDSNRMVVGRKEDLFSRVVTAEDFNWVSFHPEKKQIRASAQVRYRHRPATGNLTVMANNRVRFTFDEPQLAVTPGQALVCYADDCVLGGGWIKKNGSTHAENI